MSSTFIGRGNLGNNPELKYPEVNGEKRVLLEFRVYFDRQRPDGNGGFVDKGGFFRTVTIWGYRAEALAKIIFKGTRVCVHGSEEEVTWTDEKSKEERSKIVLHADYVDLDPVKIESIKFKARDTENNQ